MKNLLIVGAGVYGLVAMEIAESMGIFDRISFLDDFAKSAYGKEITGTLADAENLLSEYECAAVAIGNPKLRRELLEKLKSIGYETPPLVSPLAYVAPSARIEGGSFVEPMAVVHSGAEISEGVIISAGAVVNHKAVCLPFSHVDCNATLCGFEILPEGFKLPAGEVYKSKP